MTRVEAFRARLNATWREGSWIEVRYRSQDAGVAASVLGVVVNEVLAATEKRNEDRRAGNSSQLDRRVSERKDKLDEELGALKAQRTSSETGDVEARRLLLEQQRRGFMDALVAAQTGRGAKEAIKRMAETKDGALVAARNDPQIMVANGRVAELEDRLGELLANLGERHPDVASTREQLVAARARVTSLVGSFQQSAESQYRLALAEEGRLRDLIRRVQDEIAALDANSTDYTIAKRQSDWTKYSLETVLQKGQIAADTVIEAKVVLPPYRPATPADPQRGRTYALASVAALLAVALYLVFFEQMNETVRLPEDLHRVPEVRLLGSIPRIKSLAPANVSEKLLDLKDGFGDSLRIIRTNLIFSASAYRRAKVLVVTSASPQEGKSTTAVALAHAFREVSSRVLLIDGDLRRPSVHLSFGHALQPGVSDIVAGGGKDITPRTTATAGLDVLTAGNPQALSSALLSSDGMAALLEQARTGYDWVIVDAPPALALPDASILATQADGVIVVCASEKTRLREIAEVASQIQSVGGSILGAVLNLVDLKRHAYYYGRAYSGYYKSANPGRGA